jgi:NAD(P)H dehydrogenase (quinone)
MSSQSNRQEPVMPVKLAIIYYSTYGTNHQMAEIAAEAARATGAEVRLLKVQETAPQAVIDTQDGWKAQVERSAAVAVASPADMEWADAYLFSFPTRFGSAPSQLRAFIDTLGGQWFTGALANKGVSAMTSAQNVHGGQEATILGLLPTFMHWGSVYVAPGYTDPVLFKAGGNPYGYSHTQGADFTDEAKAAIGHQVRRLVDITARIRG